MPTLIEIDIVGESDEETPAVAQIRRETCRWLRFTVIPHSNMPSTTIYYIDAVVYIDEKC